MFFWSFTDLLWVKCLIKAFAYFFSYWVIYFFLLVAWCFYIFWTHVLDRIYYGEDFSHSVGAGCRLPLLVVTFDRQGVFTFNVVHFIYLFSQVYLNAESRLFQWGEGCEQRWGGRNFGALGKTSALTVA